MADTGFITGLRSFLELLNEFPMTCAVLFTVGLIVFGLSRYKHVTTRVR